MFILFICIDLTFPKPIKRETENETETDKRVLTEQQDKPRAVFGVRSPLKIGYVSAEKRAMT